MSHTEMGQEAIRRMVGESDAVNNKIFRPLAQAMGQEELAEEPRFQTITRRVENRDEGRSNR